MSEATYDPWGTSTGLWDDAVVDIKDATATYDAQVQDGKACIVLMEGVFVEGGPDDDAQFSQWFTTGNGYEPRDRGTRLAREDGKQKEMNVNAAYARFFTSLLNTAREHGQEAALRARTPEGPMAPAALWRGLRLRLGREQYQWTPRGESTPRDASRLIVTEIVSGLDGGVGQPPTTAPANTATTQQSSAGPVQETPDGAGSDDDTKIRAKMKVLARQSENHNQFVERGFEIPGVMDNPTYEAMLMDEGPGSIWAEAHPS